MAVFKNREIIYQKYYEKRTGFFHSKARGTFCISPTAVTVFIQVVAGHASTLPLECAVSWIHFYQSFSFKHHKKGKRMEIKLKAQCHSFLHNCQLDRKCVYNTGMRVWEFLLEGSWFEWFSVALYYDSHWPTLTHRKVNSFHFSFPLSHLMCNH